MTFKINGDTWRIKQISNEDMMILTNDKENFTHGLTEYSKLEISLNEEAPNKKRTLYHELMHCFMYEYGHNQFNNKAFDYEDICEISANSHDLIHNIVEAYMKYAVKENK